MSDWVILRVEFPEEVMYHGTGRTRVIMERLDTPDSPMRFSIGEGWDIESAFDAASVNARKRDVIIDRTVRETNSCRDA